MVQFYLAKIKDILGSFFVIHSGHGQCLRNQRDGRLYSVCST